MGRGKEKIEGGTIIDERTEDKSRRGGDSMKSRAGRSKEMRQGERRKGG